MAQTVGFLLRNLLSSSPFQSANIIAITRPIWLLSSLVPYSISRDTPLVATSNTAFTTVAAMAVAALLFVGFFAGIAFTKIWSMLTMLALAEDDGHKGCQHHDKST